MPTYLYKNIETGEIYELIQSMRDDAHTTHPQTGVPVKRILARSSIAFKGSGFYANDSRKGGGSEGSSGASSTSSTTGSASTSGSTGSSSSTSGTGSSGSAGSKGGE
ncbi:FmdB family transcriptional regulator [Deinococcus sp.]|uniref:FmdB family zinc ribbon protein n=1 Tax=Deinococcus sp. TaxID=47478 RepID=UPI002869D70E|nr:FmdB family transcriptional regulator [Deinococcus sp.]